MIVMRIHGGLGNQLFQHAAAQTLRKRTGAAVSYLIDDFAAHRVRDDRPLLLPELVDCAGRILPETSWRARSAYARYRLLRPRSSKLVHIPGLCHITSDAGYVPAFDRIGNGMLVSGYFQARQCVADSLADLRQEIKARFGARVEAARKELTARHGPGRKLALHVRLGDYLLIGDGQEAVVPLERIRAALQQAGEGSTIIAFTDSPEMLATLDLGEAVTLHDSGDALEDFAAMVACDDFIIANSTYSWWASVLGETPDKKIWAPADWSRPARPGSDPANDLYLPEHRIY